MMRRGYVVVGTVIAVVNLPISFIVAILLAPFWNWFEDRFHIEAIGHSGPATWALIATYLACLTCEMAIWKALTYRSDAEFAPGT